VRFLIGFGIGVVLGIMFAPAPGERTRAELARRLRDLSQVPERKVQEKVDKVAARAEAKAGEIGSRVGREVAEAAVKAVRSEVRGDEGKRTS